MKQFTLGAVAVSLLFSPAALAVDAPLEGTVIRTEEMAPTVHPEDLKEIEKGTPLEMVVSTSIGAGISTGGDEFFGKVTKDYVVDGKIVIPRDTLVHGLVEELQGPKRAGRNGFISTRFDYLITPDGREIPINGEHTTKDSTGKAVAKVVGRSAGYTLGGGVVGAMLVLKYGGLAAVTASNGYALAGGAAVGGAVGLTAAMVTKGKHALIPPGAEIKVKLQEKLVLPTVEMPEASANDVKLDGLKVSVLGTRIAKDPFGEPNELTLSLDMANQTDHTFTFFDIALEDEHGSLFYASPFGDTGLWFQKLLPQSRLAGNLTFNVDNPKLRHTLIFFKQYTREPLTRITLTTEMMQNKHSKKASVGG